MDVRVSTGRIVHKVSGSVVAETEFGLNEATRGLTKLDLREQELIDMEVARKLQEEEVKVRGVGGWVGGLRTMRALVFVFHVV